jgi:acyl transferase domain-containing protein
MGHPASCYDWPLLRYNDCLSNLLVKSGADIVAGEIAAAYAAGHLRASEAIVLAYFRGQVASANRRDGLMIAVGLGSNEVKPYLAGHEGRANIAAINSPESTTLSGDSEVIRSLVETFTAQNVFNRVLKTKNNAYHSHHMLSLGETYEQQITRGLRDIELIRSDPRRPLTTWISSVSPQDEADATLPRYWRQNLESPVLFSDAVSRLAKDVPADLMIEIGPHTALSGPLKQLRKLETTLPPYLGSLRRGEDDVNSMLNLAGGLFLNNAPIDLVAVNASEQVHHEKLQLCHGYTCVDMPQYSFSYPAKPLYHENRFNREIRLRRYLRHDLLGSRQAGGSKSHPSWRNILRVKDLPWLNDHKLIPHAVLPAAAYIAMAVEAVRQVHSEQKHLERADSSRIHGYNLRTVFISSAMKLEDGEYGVETILNMEKVASTTSNVTPVWYKFTIGSMSVTGTGTWTENCSGTICVDTRNTTVHQVERLQIDPHSRLLDVDRWYDKFQEVGLGFGPSFQCLSRLQACRGARSAVADVALGSTTGLVNGGESEYALHPATIDACLQLALISMHSGQTENANRAYVPVFLDNVSLWASGPSEKEGRAIAAGEFVGQRGAYAQAQLFTMSGKPLLDMGELKCVMFDGSSGSKESPQLIREPYWKVVSMIDIDTLTDRHAQTLFPSMDPPGSKMDEVDELCKHVLVDLEQRIIRYPAERQIPRHHTIAAWVQAKIAHPTSLEITQLGSHELQVRIKTQFSKLNNIPEVRCIEKIYNNIEHVMDGQTNSIKLLRDSHLLDELHSNGIGAVGAQAQLRYLVDLLAHKNPRIRILELGGGTGGATAAVLDTLRSKTSTKRFEEYAFTDSAGWCVVDAQMKFAGHNGMTFQVFDIQQDPEVQEFAPRSFDLVISTGALGNSINVATALGNVYGLLRPGGTLIFIEPTINRLSLEILSRSLAGSWDQTHRIRDVREWNQSLLDSGFLGAGIVLDDVSQA